MTLEEFIDTFHITLNDQQLAAVQSVDGPTLLLAVPGGGKTTVLVTRLGYMIYCCGIEPEKILTVTYTVAATKDMKSRFASVFGDKLAARLEFRTINGICARIINYYGGLTGKTPFELVTDEGFKAKILSEIYLSQTKKYPTESDLKTLSTWITYIKNMQLKSEELDILSKEENIPIKEIYSAYCSHMRSLSLMDYDDQMVYAYNIIKRSSQSLSHFQDMYQYICVDEAQDTSKIQHSIISELSAKNENLFMVGDEDQSIYGFRAAYPEALLDFEKNHFNARLLLMEENFRSGAEIVEAADRFIRKNELRHEKHMNPHRGKGTTILEMEMKDRREQYEYLAQVAENCNTDTAVLYRDNESILPVVDLLERRGLDYCIRNADLTFFSNKVVLDIQDIIMFAADPYNAELFMKIYYKIGTYMNKAAAMEACRISESRGIPILDAALQYCDIPAGTRGSVMSIKNHISSVLSENAGRAVYRINKFMGYGDYMDRVHIRGEKLQIIEAIAAGEPSAMRLIDRLQELSVIIKEKKSAHDCRLVLSTIHSSKGLEYDTVYLMDVKDGVFPERVIKDRKKASLKELKLYEEERRLYYVGVTRAKNNLIIFSFNGGSTFTGELLGKATAKPDIHAASITEYKISGIGMKQNKQNKRTVTEDKYKNKMEEIMAAGYINHKIYGEGKVLSIDGDVLVIEFKNKTAKCMLRFMMENEIIK